MLIFLVMDEKHAECNFRLGSPHCNRVCDGANELISPVLWANQQKEQGVCNCACGPRCWKSVGGLQEFLPPQLQQGTLWRLGQSYRHQGNNPLHAVTIETQGALESLAQGASGQGCFGEAVKPPKGEDTWMIASAGSKTKRWVAASISWDRSAPSAFYWGRRSQKRGISE